MPFAATYWQNGSAGGTALSAANLNAREAALAAYTDALTGWGIDAWSEGVRTSTGDNSSALNTLIASAGARPIILRPGTYGFGSPIRPRNNTRIIAWDSPRWLDISLSTTVLRANTGFSGSALIHIADSVITGTGVPRAGLLSGISLDGNARTGSNIHGLMFEGDTPDWRISNLNIRNFSGSGLRMVAYQGRVPAELHADWIYSYGNTFHGFHLVDTWDDQFISCEAAGNFGSGWDMPASLGNTEFLLCGAEWNFGGHGFHLYGANDGPVFTCCTTDRNTHNGFLIASAPSNQMINMVGCKTRRDGRNGNAGGGNYAGLAIVGTSGSYAPPVNVVGLVQQTGRDDDGTGTVSPQIGVRTTYHGPVTISGSRLWGATTALSNAGTADVHVASGTLLTTGIAPSEVNTRQP
jgi:hypothetical protein